MDRMAFIQLWADTCPDCGTKITLEGELPVGRLLVCPNCGTSLGFVEVVPTELGWASDGERKEYEDFQTEILDEDWTLQPLPFPS